MDGVVTCIRFTLGGSTLESRSRISGHNQGAQSRIVVKDTKNIARGTTDPGYRVYNLSYRFNYIEFVFIFSTCISSKFDQ